VNKAVDEVIRDFDAIASALDRAPARDVLSPAEGALLRHVPPTARRALDVGCGDGKLSRMLARRGLHVRGIDLSPRMIELARARTPDGLDVEYHVSDIMSEVTDGQYDVVISVNVVHHLPLEQIVPRLARAVAPGGVLLIQDVVTRRGMSHFAINVIAAIRSRVRRILGRSQATREVVAAYERHGAGETYLSPSEVAPAYAPLLPGARIEHHLEWRYSVVWTRPHPAGEVRR
jgi:2-polyprenyl-3-methyl-5-hydroxy-6-metoxy-1,4-benzoquinol methylase